MVAVLAAITVMVSSTPARADDLLPPPFRGMPGSTFQGWEYSTPLLGPPDAECPPNNPFGIPMASGVGNIWLNFYPPTPPQQQGVQCLPSGASLTKFIPNIPGNPPGLKTVWAQITFHPHGFIPAFDASAIGTNGEIPFIAGTVDLPVPGRPGWTHRTIVFCFDGCPDSVTVNVTALGPPDSHVDVDQLLVDTICHPLMCFPPPPPMAPGDFDGDGFDDFTDNAPGVANGGQADCDGDGIGNVSDLWGMCPPGTPTELEPCGADTNGGCDSIPPAFEALTCPGAVCGTVWADGGVQDSDWYELVVPDTPEPGNLIELTVTLCSALPTVAWLYDNRCDTLPLFAAAEALPDVVGSFTICVPPGTYYLEVAPGTLAGSLLAGFPCNTAPNEYFLQTQCTEPCGVLEECGDPASGDCCSIHGSPACNDEDCCDAICAADPYCCIVEWDGHCVSQAQEHPDCDCECEPDCADEKINVECLLGKPYDNSRFVGRLNIPKGTVFDGSPLLRDTCCTGWIVAAPDCILTNAHCLPDNLSDVANYTIDFTFECDACAGGVCKEPSVFNITGVIAHDVAQDWALLRVNADVASQFGQARIDPSLAAAGETIYEIHHASCLKKGYDEGVILSDFSVLEYHISAVASPGASGSPVFRTTNDCVTAMCHAGPYCDAGFALKMSTIWPNVSIAIEDAGCTALVCGDCEPDCPNDKLNVECLNPGPEYDNSRFVGILKIPESKRVLTEANCCTAWIVAAPDCILTNAHCLDQDDPANVAGYTIDFTFECTECVSDECKDPTSFDVLELLAHSFDQDWALMRVDGDVASMFGQARIDPTPAVRDLEVYEIHHSSCLKKGYVPGIVTDPDHPHEPGCPGNIDQYEITVISNPGASGSPIFRQDNHCVTAMDHCGPAGDCPPFAWALPMETIWPNVLAAIEKAGCTPQVCECPESDHNCFTEGGPGCTDPKCCELVCKLDPFCCTSGWDALCVTLAIELCDGCGDPFSGDCCTEHDTPFCDDRDCCERICMDDAFCCEIAWDALCVEAALANPLCNCICPESNHNCFTTGDPGCTSKECCAAVCVIDPFCCEVAWDPLCVEEAIELCDGCGDPVSGDCCIEHDAPFCDDRDCCERVCATDAFCCKVAWDALCASAALTNALCDCACPADLSPPGGGDGMVNAGDLGELLANWGLCSDPANCPADIFPPGSGDDEVDAGDLAELLANWGPCP
jgi:hypothetical protein